MDFTQLHTFVQVAWNGGFNRAAIVLDVSQSTASTRVARLEEELGRPLFARKGRSTELTEDGKEFLAFAEKVVGLKFEALQVLQAGGRQKRHQRLLRIGANNTSAVAVVPSLVHRFHEHVNDGRVSIKLLVETSHGLMPALMEGAVEIAFVNAGFAHRHCRVLWFYESPITLVVHPEHRFAGETVHPKDLIDEPFVTYSLGPASGLTQRLAGEMGTDVRSLVESNDTALVVSLAKSGLGLCFLPEACVRGDLAAGTLTQVRVVGLDHFRWETVLVRWRDRPTSEEAGAFVQMLRGTGADSDLAEQSGRAAGGTHAQP